jgi:hypothetical protein
MAAESIPRNTFSLAAHLTEMLQNATPVFLVVLLSVCGSAYCQSTRPLFQEREDVQHALAALSKCLSSQQVACVARLSSSSGVSLGIDGPRISRRSLVQKLSSDNSIRCFFWGSHCSSSGPPCSVYNALVTVERSDIGKPRLYGEHWQVDVHSKPQGTGCAQGLPFVFRLENGYWKLAAIPYT